MGTDRPRLRAGLIFAATLGAGLAAWPLVSSGFSAGFAHAANAWIAPLEFGAGGRVTFQSVERREARGAEDAVSWDVRAGLRQEGSEGALWIELNPRRLAYLPLLVFAAALAAAPVPLRRRTRGLALGVPLVLAGAGASVWIALVFVFSRAPGLIYDFAPWQRAAVDFAYEAGASSLGNRFVFPLAIAALLLWPRREPARSRETRSPRARTGSRRSRRRTGARS